MAASTSSLDFSDALGVVLSLVSLGVALVALTINLTALLRRPRIVAEWGTIQETQPYGFMEGLQ